MSFFSHINSSKTAQTVHDEYWHSHIDTEQYGTFAYTSILYLNTQGQEPRDDSWGLVSMVLGCFRGLRNLKRVGGRT